MKLNFKIFCRVFLSFFSFHRVELSWVESSCIQFDSLEKLFLQLWVVKLSGVSSAKEEKIVCKLLSFHFQVSRGTDEKQKSEAAADTVNEQAKIPASLKFNVCFHFQAASTSDWIFVLLLPSTTTSVESIKISSLSESQSANSHWRTKIVNFVGLWTKIDTRSWVILLMWNQTGEVEKNCANFHKKIK